MTCKEYLDELMKTYAPVRSLSGKNGTEVLQLRHRSLEQDLILRSSRTHIEAYERILTLRTPNLPEVYEVMKMEDGEIILEEFIDGMSVADILETRLFSYHEAAYVLRGVLSALHILHSHGIIHRDVKPENVMVNEINGRVALIDLNASRILSGAKRDTVIMGTVGFLPPEQLGLTESDERTDIYSVGVLLNVMLTGKLPTEKSPEGKACRIIDKCLYVNPARRYQSALELLKAL